jgi:hypothetical protein
MIPIGGATQRTLYATPLHEISPRRRRRPISARRCSHSDYGLERPLSESSPQPERVPVDVVLVVALGVAAALLMSG